MDGRRYNYELKMFAQHSGRVAGVRFGFSLDVSEESWLTDDSKGFGVKVKSKSAYLAIFVI